MAHYVNMYTNSYHLVFHNNNATTCVNQSLHWQPENICATATECYRIHSILSEVLFFFFSGIQKSWVSLDSRIYIKTRWLIIKTQKVACS